MRKAFDTVAITGTVVIGEGEMDEAPMLYIGAGILLMTLGYQYLETVGAVHWPALKAIISINGQVVLIESTVMGTLALTALLNRRHAGEKA